MSKLATTRKYHVSLREDCIIDPRILLGCLRSAGEASHLREIGAKQEEVRGHREHVLGVLGGLGHDLSSAAGAAAPLPAKPKPGKEAEGLEAALKELEALWPHVPHAEYLHAAKAQALLQLGRCVHGGWGECVGSVCLVLVGCVLGRGEEGGSGTAWQRGVPGLAGSC